LKVKGLSPEARENCCPTNRIDYKDEEGLLPSRAYNRSGEKAFFYSSAPFSESPEFFGAHFHSGVEKKNNLCYF